jgi:geranylgeranyl pyrophosphate synthase
MAPRRAAAEAWLGRPFADAWPGAFVAALRYPLETPGKRVRPILAIATYEAVTGRTDADWERVLPVAGALELVHTYSLVHDDLPAMDDAATRRGRPTVHKEYGDAAAILVGDALLTEAFAVLAASDLPPVDRIALVALIARAAGYRGMVGGQAADIGVGGATTDEAGLIRLHRLKTGALIEAAAVAGAIVGGASPPQRMQLGHYGKAVGLAFQLADDLLDADEDAGDDGPPSFVKLLGAPETRVRAQALVDEACVAARAAVPDAAEPLCRLAAYIVERTL